jgi:hypothetical protein
LFHLELKQGSDLLHLGLCRYLPNRAVRKGGGEALGAYPYGHGKSLVMRGRPAQSP